VKKNFARKRLSEHCKTARGGVRICEITEEKSRGQEGREEKGIPRMNPQNNRKPKTPKKGEKGLKSLKHCRARETKGRAAKNVSSQKTKVPRDTRLHKKKKRGG